VSKLCVSILVGIVALGGSAAALFAGGQPSTSTKIAVVNVGQVFAKYKKAIDYKAEMEELLKPYKAQREKWNNDIIAFQKAIANASTSNEDKVKYQKAVVDYKRALEDLDVETQKKVGKKQEEQITGLFRDLNNAVGAYAKANGIHMVLGYGQQLEGDLFTFANITRQMQGMDLGSTTPLYMAPGMDISQAVADVLNQGYRPVSASPTSKQK